MSLKSIKNEFGLDEKKTEFLRYVSLPKAFRPHRKFICAKLEIPEWQYYQWVNDPTLSDARDKMIKQLFKDDVSDVVMAMRDEALAGNERAARLFLEYVMDWNKKDGGGDDDDNARRMDEIPIIEVKQTIINLQQKFYGNSNGTNHQIAREAEPLLRGSADAA